MSSMQSKHDIIHIMSARFICNFSFDDQRSVCFNAAHT
jgi:hypothetical protein